MGQFDQLAKKARSAADAAGKKTGELVELSKLKLATGQLRSQIKEKEGDLGNAVYHMHKEGYQNPEFVNAVVAQIDELTQQLDTLQEKIARLKKTVKCPCCGASNPIQSSYCGQCGCALQKPEEDAADEPSDSDQDEI